MILIDPVTGVEATAVHTARVTMRPYSDREVEQYVASGDPFDKAGAYAIQSPSFQPVASLAGCYLGVMGLCVCQLPDLLRRHDLHARFDMKALAAAHRGYDCPDFAKIARKQSK
jgi:predicted house-cleaning NTP pyrophosphatase (Maf/HAM1 superfamily)